MKRPHGARALRSGGGRSCGTCRSRKRGGSSASSRRRKPPPARACARPTPTRAGARSTPAPRRASAPAAPPRRDAPESSRRRPGTATPAPTGTSARALPASCPATGSRPSSGCAWLCPAARGCVYRVHRLKVPSAADAGSAASTRSGLGGSPRASAKVSSPVPKASILFRDRASMACIRNCRQDAPA